MDINIEKEVEERVRFKMNEFLTSMENRCKIEWNVAATTGHPKHNYYLEAFSQMKGMFQKEIDMPTPYDNMSEIKRRDIRDKAIEKLNNRLIKRGNYDSFQKEQFVYQVLNELTKELF
jgi:hypothetical protein